MRKKWAIATVLIAFLTVSLQAQQGVDRGSINVRWHGGFLFAHHPDMRHLVTRHLQGFELNYQRQFSGKKEWHHAYNLPSWGISGLVLPNINANIGSAIAAFPYYYLPLTSDKKIQLNLKVGAGLGILTKRYERIENHKNNAISTHLNATIQLGLDLRVKILPRLSWETGLFITHFSNGAIKMPNLGLNFLTVNTGFSYRLSPAPQPVAQNVAFEQNKNIQWSLFAGAGLKKAQVEQANALPAVSVQLLAEKRLTRKFSLGAGLEFNYNKALPLAYEAKSIVVDPATPLRGGLVVGTAFHFGHMAIIAQAGGYVLDPNLIDGRIFNRFGLRHEVSDRLRLNLTLRTHFAKADHFEIGLVYRLSML